MKAIRAPRAAAIPALRALARPPLGWRMTVKLQVASARARSITAGVSSCEPSSTNTTSYASGASV